MRRKFQHVPRFDLQVAFQNRAEHGAIDVAGHQKMCAERLDQTYLRGQAGFGGGDVFGADCKLDSTGGAGAVKDFASYLPFSTIRAGGRQEVHWRVSNKARDETFGGVAVNLDRGGSLNNAPFVHDRDPVGERHCLDLVVGHVDCCRVAFGQYALQFGAHFQTQKRVEVGQRFIHQDHVWFHCQCTGHGHTLTLTARKFAGITAQKRLDMHQLGGPLHAALLAKGAKVVMLNRSTHKSQDAVAALKEEFGSGAGVGFVRMDLASLASVREAAAEVLKTVPRIDALMCNAAIAQVPTQKLTVDGHESMLGTNHYGHFLLAGLLFERIEKSNGRIVVVSSLGYNMGIKTIQFDDMNWDKNYHPNKTYSQSKLAQMMFAYELQDRLAAAGKTNVEVYVCHPGASRTSLFTTSGSRLMRFTWWLMTLSPFVQSAERGSWPEVMCATQNGLEQRALYGPTGRMESTGPVGKGTLNPHAYDKPVMERLWALSEKETGFSWTI